MQRNFRGYTLLEIMIAISLLAVVIALLYNYYNKGFLLFDKNISYSKLQADSRACLDQIANQIKLSSHDLIYTGKAYNRNVPFPEDVLLNKSYIYFALPQKQDFKIQDIQDRDSQIQAPNFDYYLYYIARAKNPDDTWSKDKAKLKLLIIKNQDGFYTLEHAQSWPFLPPKLVGKPHIEAENGMPLAGLSVSKISLEDLSDEFEAYAVDYSFSYFGLEYDNLYKFKINMIENNTKVSYETAASPRN